MLWSTTTSGAEALDRLAEGIPDVIVSDVMMPGLSGFELIGRIRAQIARVAQVKGLMGDRQWKLTPFSVTEPIL